MPWVWEMEAQILGSLGAQLCFELSVGLLRSRRPRILVEEGEGESFC